MPKISIIVPVYNGEEYIERCVNSILKQKDLSIADLEIILINDGSIDGSWNVLNHFSQQYPEIVIAVNQKNIGVAKTRNKGIKLARGEYIAFCDQDDYYLPTTFSVLYKKAKEANADVVSCGYKRENMKGELKYKISLKNTEYSKYMVMAAWSKLHKRAFLAEKNIEFFNNSYGEDTIFTLMEIRFAERWIIVPNYIGYMWLYNESSVSNTLQVGFKNNDGHDQYLTELLNMKVEIKKEEIFCYFLLREWAYYVLRSGKTATPKDFINKSEIIVRAMQQKYPHIFKNKYGFFGPPGEIFSIRSAVLLLLLLRRFHLFDIFAKFYCRRS